MRDWKKFRIFELADKLVLSTYKTSTTWSVDHRYGLTQQLQRAVLSIASNIVEGCSRSSEREFLRFIEISYASSCEAQYQLSVAARLGFDGAEALESDAAILARSINSMLRVSSGSRSPKSEV